VLLQLLLLHLHAVARVSRRVLLLVHAVAVRLLLLHWVLQPARSSCLLRSPEAPELRILSSRIAERRVHTLLLLLHVVHVR
jgi:hypothetical protein